MNACFSHPRRRRSITPRDGRRGARLPLDGDQRLADSPLRRDSSCDRPRRPDSRGNIADGDDACSRRGAAAEAAIGGSDGMRGSSDTAVCTAAGATTAGAILGAFCRCISSPAPISEQPTATHAAAALNVRWRGARAAAIRSMTAGSCGRRPPCRYKRTSASRNSRRSVVILPPFRRRSTLGTATIVCRPCARASAPRIVWMRLPRSCRARSRDSSSSESNGGTSTLRSARAIV